MYGFLTCFSTFCLLTFYRRTLFHILRITPAYAGKRRQCPAVQSQKQDHPRLCGEKEDFSGTYRRFEGSPPPMRGKEDGSYNLCLGRRITPAYAGKRHQLKVAQHTYQDHPRLCGEKSRRVEKNKNGGRITPAYAGKRQSSHPHLTP